MRLESNSFDSSRLFVIDVAFNGLVCVLNDYYWMMFKEREVIGNSVTGGRLVIDEDDTEEVSVNSDLVLLEGVTAVTLRV